MPRPREKPTNPFSNNSQYVLYYIKLLKTIIIPCFVRGHNSGSGYTHYFEKLRVDQCR